MSDAITIKSKTIAGREVQVREITVAEARVIFADRGGDIFGDLLFKECRLSDLRVMTNLSEDALDAMTPSQVAEVIKLAKEQNPHFFELLDRLSKAPAAA
ncbi:hypothetical protein [Metapseudomonas furukawaii]|uniref:Phage protein n=1 Tax=Metapseudomonas furukawaii TaxID=1149133 RepID=A0AAD1C3H2_METFU|nr:hypothetical protein [Pseudomonas furukawaii]ELS25681.1 hypothetical protein ppKF707_0777 [Pseudomonas furukawaii]BAU76130.1 phage protein [Pseudomonas furukawaii]